MPTHPSDEELDPKKLKFGLSREQVKELERKERQRRKKLAKNWKPTTH